METQKTEVRDLDYFKDQVAKEFHGVGWALLNSIYVSKEMTDEIATRYASYCREEGRRKVWDKACEAQRAFCSEAVIESFCVRDSEQAEKIILNAPLAPYQPKIK